MFFLRQSRGIRATTWISEKGPKTHAPPLAERPKILWQAQSPIWAHSASNLPCAKTTHQSSRNLRDELGFGKTSERHIPQQLRGDTPSLKGSFCNIACAKQSPLGAQRRHHQLHVHSWQCPRLQALLALWPAPAHNSTKQIWSTTLILRFHGRSVKRIRHLWDSNPRGETPSA